VTDQRPVYPVGLSSEATREYVEAVRLAAEIGAETVGPTSLLCLWLAPRTADGAPIVDGFWSYAFNQPLALQAKGLETVPGE